MDLNIAPAVAELKTFTTAFGNYHSLLLAWLNDPSKTPPSFLNTNFKTVDTLSTAYVTQNLSASSISGYLIDAVNHMGASQREIGIRYKSKAAYYLDAAQEVGMEASNYDVMNAEYSQAFRGLSTI